eukprot:TRINITY_DN14890_c0_g1_i1.p1 TRINITY_DN14890_c0_g1~~TRINITY_DN14890_c0_g1_i1.p1  ORF type:complete len:100 (-),score=38.54 TRINITY_DN14890_c0_g1_i1:46-345(-)
MTLLSSKMLPRRFQKQFLTQWPLDRSLMKMSWRQNLMLVGEELELEEQEELDKQLLDVGPAVGLPEVPAAEPAKPASVPARARKEEEDPDMAELAAWAS